jgi:hypothetical protein
LAGGKPISRKMSRVHASESVSPKPAAGFDREAAPRDRPEPWNSGGALYFSRICGFWSRWMRPTSLPLWKKRKVGVAVML